MLISVLNEGGLLEFIRWKFARLVENGLLSTREEKEVVLIDQWGVHVVGNSNGSGGYFYLRVGLKKAEEMGKDVKYTEATEQGTVVWSTEVRPSVGSSVTLTRNHCGDGTVLTYFNEGAWQYGLALLPSKDVEKLPEDWEIDEHRNILSKARRRGDDMDDHYASTRIVDGKVGFWKYCKITNFMSREFDAQLLAS